MTGTKAAAWPTAPLETPPQRPTSLDRRGVSLVLVSLIVAWLPALLGSGVVGAVSDLYPLAATERPYWVPEHLVLLYVAAPLVALSSFVFLLSPGMLVTLATGAARSVGELVVYGLAASLLIVSLAAGIAQGIAGAPLRGGAFVIVVVLCSFAGAVLLYYRTRASGRLRSPTAGLPALAALLLPPLVLVAALVPKLFWENLNGDGAHTLEAARLLLHSPVPFWSSEAGSIANWPGLAAAVFIYPVSWFIRLFGPLEAAVRLPFLLFVTVLYAGIAAISVDGTRRVLRTTDRLLVWLALAVYTVVMAFSATYNPYRADIALPGAQDTLQLALFMGLVLCFLRGQTAWTALFVLLNLFCSPNGLLLLGLWAGAALAMLRPVPWTRVATAMGALVAGVFLSAAIPDLLAWSGQPAPGGEHGLSNLIAKFRLVQFTDWGRIAYLVLPGGIVPALALLAWPWQDRTARALTLVAVAYFVLFYFQAYLSLHYFVPAMVIPIAVLWRSGFLWDSEHRPKTLAVTAVAGVAALVLSLPSDARVHTEARQVGSAIQDRLEGYAESEPAAFRRVELYRAIVPAPGDPSVPDESYGGSPLVLNYYAHQSRRASEPPNYVLQSPGDPAPAGMRVLAATEEAVLYLRSDSVLHHHRAFRPVSTADNRFYHMPKTTLFRAHGQRDGKKAIDVVELLSRVLP